MEWVMGVVTIMMMVMIVTNTEGLVLSVVLQAFHWVVSPFVGEKSKRGLSEHSWNIRKHVVNILVACENMSSTFLEEKKRG
jgi:hypothetical protein